MRRTIWKLVHKYPVQVLLSYAILSRLVVALCYQNISYFNDSENYIDLAQRFIDSNFWGYDGARTPGYPLFLALFGNNHIIVVMIQNILGVCSTYMLYAIGRKLLPASWTLFSCLLISSYLPFIFYDFAILTESLTTFLFISLIYSTLYFVNAQKLKWIRSVLIACICGFLFLVRPFFIFVPVFIVAYALYQHRNAINRHLWAQMGLVLLIPFLAFYTWNKINQHNTGQFMITWYEGYNLMQVGTTFYEGIPDQHAVIREEVIKQRDSIASENGDIAMSIWYARKGLKQKTGMEDLELSLLLKQIGRGLIVKHPMAYAKQVVVSIGAFFGGDSTMLWNRHEFRHDYIGKAFSGFWRFIQQPVLYCMNIGWLLSILILLFKYKGLNSAQWLIYVWLASIILTAAVLQAMVTYGNNSRFFFPFTPFVLLLVIFTIRQFYRLKADPTPI